LFLLLVSLQVLELSVPEVLAERFEEPAMQLETSAPFLSVEANSLLNSQIAATIVTPIINTVLIVGSASSETACDLM
jgi:cytochrome c oxidase assembly factor CtaG